jgi:hypothetical protein
MRRATPLATRLTAGLFSKPPVTVIACKPLSAPSAHQPFTTFTSAPRKRLNQSRAQLLQLKAKRAKLEQQMQQLVIAPLAKRQAEGYGLTHLDFKIKVGLISSLTEQLKEINQQIQAIEPTVIKAEADPEFKTRWYDNVSVAFQAAFCEWEDEEPLGETEGITTTPGRKL